jgi:membrane-associated protease RseP (regulator of RpoE activity)
MVSFVVYDLAFLVLFSAFVAWFLYGKRKSGALTREGLMYLYRTKFGMKAIDYIGKKCKKTLHVLKYLIVAVGVFLMGIMLWILGQAVYNYIKFPQITKIIKAPPIAPVIPYFPKLFGLQSFFPPFYFTYFIVALAIVAIVHEFSHGIFMKLFKIRIKSTGLVFLGPILGAFVEEDRRNFEKKSNLEQMSVLGAGVFANTLFALVFYGLLVGFFLVSFSPAGYVFNDYAMSQIPVNQISGFENSSFGNLTTVSVGEDVYYLDEKLSVQLERQQDFLIAYDDAAAINVGLRGAITKMNDVEIGDQADLISFLSEQSPGDAVTVVTNEGEFDLVLGEHPLDDSRAYLGVGSLPEGGRGFVGGIFAGFMSFKKASTHYEPTWDGDFVVFIYDLLWWIMVLNILVAIFNMLPLGILDGGRFFYLAALSITRSDGAAKSLSKIMKYLILFGFLALMFFWFVGIIL